MASLIIRIVLSLETKVGIIAGYGGLYKLGCRSSLALVNKEGEASGASADRAYADGAYADGAFIDGAYTDGACTGGAYTDGGCADGGCADGT